MTASHSLRNALPFPIWYFKVHRAVAYAKFRAGDQSARIEVLNAAGEVIETVEHNPSRRGNSNTLGGDFISGEEFDDRDKQNHVADQESEFFVRGGIVCLFCPPHSNDKMI
jgi:hypothetical protein